MAVTKMTGTWRVRSRPRMSVWRLRAQLYRARADAETSLMAKGVFTEAARASDARLEDGPGR